MSNATTHPKALHRKHKTQPELKALGVFFSFALLQSCGDNYPDIGKFNGGNFFAKNISKYSTVYTSD